jgi:nucleotide-binding universal stress UspA family protein
MLSDSVRIVFSNLGSSLTKIASGDAISSSIVHAFEPEEIALATPEVRELLDDARREAELTLTGLVEGIRRGYPNCEMEFRVGEPAEQIALMAKTLNADLVVAIRTETPALRCY